VVSTHSSVRRAGARPQFLALPREAPPVPLLRDVTLIDSPG
jgi:hypothetical protein